MSYSALTDPYGIPDPIALNAAGALNASTVVSAFGNLSVAGVEEDDSFYSFSVTGTVNLPLDIGKAVSVDVTAPTSVKLCGSGDIILGQLKSLEKRTMEGITVGAVMCEGGMVLPIDTTGGSVAPAVGDSVQGGVIPGTVMKLAAAQGRGNVVLAVDSANHVCTVLFL